MTSTTTIAATPIWMTRTGYGLSGVVILFLAMDITIKWSGTIQVIDARGVTQNVMKQQDLWPVGASYGVHKLPSDAPHWSSDGH